MQALNELEYAIQAQHANPIARGIWPTEQENAEAIKFYINNLRPDLAYCTSWLCTARHVTHEAQQRAIDAETFGFKQLPTEKQIIKISIHLHVRLTID
ncbi:hypothetical protein K0M31_002637 [Melipona bicolor]|uniref:Uncharacterized protein n=1 Tax=Melipona bicolor TaxID=60889 RepID=A0AA40KZ18_9HYME|nr:hypothetical protein K0M31_002637 [Melipona bicolor]